MTSPLTGTARPTGRPASLSAGLMAGARPLAIVPRTLEEASHLAQAIVASGLAPAGLQLRHRIGRTPRQLAGLQADRKERPGGRAVGGGKAVGGGVVVVEAAVGLRLRLDGERESQQSLVHVGEGATAGADARAPQQRKMVWEEAPDHAAAFTAQVRDLGSQPLVLLL